MAVVSHCGGLAKCPNLNLAFFKTGKATNFYRDGVLLLVPTELFSGLARNRCRTTPATTRWVLLTLQMSIIASSPRMTRKRSVVIV